jgi:hypothetical protein
VVTGPWRNLVFGRPARGDGAVNRHAYTFCVLEQFWRHLKRREIYAYAFTRWRNPKPSCWTAKGGRPSAATC